jgi:DNA topoisomerase-1
MSDYNYMLTGIYLVKQFGPDCSLDGGAKSKKKWTTLEHHGPSFPPPYVPHHIPVIYNGERIELGPAAEECATLYAKFTETEYLKNSTFRKNFWHDWKDVLGLNHPIKDLTQCDFSLIYEHLLKVKEEKKLQPKKDKSDEEKYKIAIVDGVNQPVGNFRIEPPGIFLGRGCNPHLGKIKKRIYPEDITINIGKEAKVPDPPVGHHWGSIVHDHDVEWLASWKDTITDKNKYVWLGAHSDLKGQHDKEKFELARKLKRKMKTIREEYEAEFKSSDAKMRQLATALYFIDRFALRVGNEKGDDETDTVGVTSLRVEHFEILDPYKLKLDFVGKDSVRYNRTLEVEPAVYSNIETFMQNKEMSDQLFGLINSSDINKYLQSFMKNLTAKVYRTANASSLFQKELNKISSKYETYEEVDKINILLDEYNKANAKIAILCNHQKNVGKSNTQKVEKMNEQIKKQKAKIRKMNASKKKNPEKIKLAKDKLKKMRAKKELFIELKNVSLGTSRTNYLDPRITISFLKKHNIPVDKIFSSALQDKFKWAFDIEPDFKF